jgi:signal transduction histidine kinase
MHHQLAGAIKIIIAVVGMINAGSLPLRRRWPVSLALFSGASVLLEVAAGYLSPAMALPTVTALYSVGLTGRWLRMLLVGVTAVGVACAAALRIQGHDLVSVDSLDSLAHSCLMVTPILVGGLVGTWRAKMELLTERAELAVRCERDAQRLRLELERRRVARDLHDGIGHALTTINVQAGVAVHLLAINPEFARQALVEIAAASGEAMRDVRGIVGVLRDSEDVASPVAPGPGLGDVAGLVERARRLGIDVTLATTGEIGRLPRSAQVAGYRIVQESLTNVHKHAGSVRATVEVEIHDGNRATSDDAAGGRVDPDQGRGGRHVRIRVWNVKGAAVDPSPDTSGGAGLVGMRERAASLGGTLDAGRTPEGGFAVVAWLPLSETPPTPRPRSNS